jgi:hypothetical protein
MDRNTGIVYLVDIAVKTGFWMKLSAVQIILRHNNVSRSAFLRGLSPDSNVRSRRRFFEVCSQTLSAPNKGVYTGKYPPPPPSGYRKK